MLLYSFLIVIILELLVRIFHLAKDTPTRFVDGLKVEKWEPGQEGHSVTGNRRQNFSEYKINNSGFNSYREFTPTAEKIEIALVGDSFIEGFHQHYFKSIGKKIEDQLPNVEVYEYGYAGYDLADQLHLIASYEKQFQLIDEVVLSLKFENDLTRSKYVIEESRLALESPMNRLIKKSKLLVYLNSIGVGSNMRSLLSQVTSLRSHKIMKLDTGQVEHLATYKKYLTNFESLVALYNFDKSKFHFLLDERSMPKDFMDYLDFHDYKYIAIGNTLSKSEYPVSLIYDRHWNNNGRSIVARIISDYFKKTATD